MKNKTYDVAVIGAGVFGGWTAYELRRSGKQVILIDAYGAGNSRSSSGDESRIIRMGYGGDEIYTRSARRSLQRWQEFFLECGEQFFRQTGVLWLAHENDPYPVKTRETLARLDIPFEHLTTAELAHRYPQIGLDKVAWAMFEPQSGVLLARRAVQAVVRAAVQQGVDYLGDAVKIDGPGVSLAGQAQGARTTLETIDTTRGRQISAAHYVFACGAWLPKLFPGLLTDRIHPTRQEVFYFGAPAGDSSFTSPMLPTWIDFKDEAYGLPDLEGRGAKVAIDRHGGPFDPDRGERIVSTEGLAEVRRYLTRRLPGLKNAPVIEVRVCQYENTSNGDFLIDRHPDYENVWLAGGGSGHGFKHGPAVGEYVAARIAGDSGGVEPRFCLAGKATEPQRAVY